MALQHCRVVLVETHYPGNLGAAARVMRNFGLDQLVLVNPIAERDDRQALQLSTHGEDILRQARVVADFGAAVADCTLVVGTSAQTGGPFRRQSAGTPDVIMPRIVEALRQDQPAALVFGNEPNGLPNDLITRCHYLVTVPTEEAYGSLNLAQAVAICLYELHRHWLKTAPLGEQGPNAPEAAAPFELQEQMFHDLQTALEGLHFLFGDKAAPLMHALRHLLGKARLTTMEAKLLLGLARQIRWYVANHPRSP